jgi:hypothetical protein
MDRMGLAKLVFHQRKVAVATALQNLQTCNELTGELKARAVQLIRSFEGIEVIDELAAKLGEAEANPLENTALLKQLIELLLVIDMTALLDSHDEIDGLRSLFDYMQRPGQAVAVNELFHLAKFIERRQPGFKLDINRIIAGEPEYVDVLDIDSESYLPSLVLALRATISATQIGESKGLTQIDYNMALDLLLKPENMWLLQPQVATIIWSKVFVQQDWGQDRFADFIAYAAILNQRDEDWNLPAMVHELMTKIPLEQSPLRIAAKQQLMNEVNETCFHQRATNPLRQLPVTPYTGNKVTLIGNGVVSTLIKVYLYLDSLMTGVPMPKIVTVSPAGQSTSEIVAPSLTKVEAGSRIGGTVMPVGEELRAALERVFSAGGIRPNIEEVEASLGYKKFVAEAGRVDERFVSEAGASLEELGELSMQLWAGLIRVMDQLIAQGHHEVVALRNVFVDGGHFQTPINFLDPSQAVHLDELKAHGYRADRVIVAKGDAEHPSLRAQAVAKDIIGLYADAKDVNCRLLTPAEFIAMQPYEKQWALENSTVSEGRCVWNEGICVVCRPGGSILLTEVVKGVDDFLSNHVPYMLTEAGVIKSRVRNRDRRVISLDEDVGSSGFEISGYGYTSPETAGTITKEDKPAYRMRMFVDASGAGIDSTAQKYLTPTVANVAGVVVKVVFDEDNPAIALPGAPSFPEKAEWHIPKQGVEGKTNWVLAYQRYGNIVMVAGTPTLYGDQWPKESDPFAQGHGLFLLRRVLKSQPPTNVAALLAKHLSGVLVPDGLVKSVFDKWIDESFTNVHMQQLIEKGVVTLTPGVRSCASTGKPLIGPVNVHDGEDVASEDLAPIGNLLLCVAGGSGGVSLAAASSLMTFTLLQEYLQSGAPAQPVASQGGGQSLSGVFHKEVQALQGMRPDAFDPTEQYRSLQMMGAAAAGARM